MAQALREPPGAENAHATGDPLHFVVGRDRTGHWVVTETHGLYGGIFCDRATALRFAKFESADRASELELISETIELNNRRQGPQRQLFRWATTFLPLSSLHGE
jgi:hypothetical protein